MSYIVTPHDLMFEASKNGFVDGKAAKTVYVLGRRDLGWTSTSALGDVAQYLDTSQAAINTPTSQQLYIVSTSTNDTSAGTGARTVRVVYLNDAGTQTVATYTLDGTTAVAIMSDATFIQWMEVATVGSGGISAGNIAITSNNGAASVADTFEFIKANANRSLSGRYKVPTGYTAYIHSWSGAAIGTGDQDVRLRADVFADDRTLSTGVFHFQATAYIKGDNRFSDTDLDYLCFPAGTVIKASSIPSATAAANKCDINFDLLLIAD
jgi:hypothetical protein